MSELKLFKRKQRYEHRSQLENGKFEMVTLEEVIKHVRALNKDSPRTVNAETKVGLYIELKDYQDQIDELGQDIAELTFAMLSKYGLGTVADCENDVPIIIQSFELDALKKFATMSDLPLVMLTSYSKSYDFDEISTVAHGVGPASAYIMNNDSLTDK